MKNTIKIFVIVALAIGSFAFTNKNDKEGKQKLEQLTGTYADPKPYNYGKAWGKRVFTFNKGKWSLVFTLALDPDMKMQVFTFRTFGTYKVQDQSKVVANAYNALFLEEKKFVTLKTNDENLINAFGFTNCDLNVNIEKDISITGCSAWKSVAECPGDYDLLSLDSKGQLYFGNRPTDNNMCSAEKRPTSLTPSVVKVKK